MAESRQIAKPSSSRRHAASCLEAIRSGGATPATQSYTGTSNALPAITVTAPRIREAEPTDTAIKRRVPLPEGRDVDVHHAAQENRCRSMCTIQAAPKASVSDAGRPLDPR
jgi:hypothetical protein